MTGPEHKYRMEYPDGQMYWQARFVRYACRCGWRSEWLSITEPFRDHQGAWQQHLDNVKGAS